METLSIFNFAILLVGLISGSCECAQEKRYTWTIFKSRIFFFHHNNVITIVVNGTKLTNDIQLGGDTCTFSPSPFSLDLAPCNFALFPRLRGDFKGVEFSDLSELKLAVNDIISSLIWNGLNLFLVCGLTGTKDFFQESGKYFVKRYWCQKVNEWAALGRNMFVFEFCSRSFLYYFYKLTEKLVNLLNLCINIVGKKINFKTW